MNRKYTFPALGIAIAAGLVIVINEYTQWPIAREYGYMLIIGGMLLGALLANPGSRARK